jgi:uncharacterized protein (TIGR03086 family)
MASLRPTMRTAAFTFWDVPAGQLPLTWDDARRRLAEQARADRASKGIDRMTSRPSTGWDILDTALEALAAVTGGIAAQDWDLPTPCEQWNVTQVLQHATGDQLAWASAITGQPGPAENPFTPSGSLNEAPVAMVDQAWQAAAQAWTRVNRDDAAVPTPLPQGPMPASLASGACALDAAIHAWDLAVATGQPSPLTVALAEALHPAASQIVEPLRGIAYAAALSPGPGDDQAAALLRYLGRPSGWKAVE